MKLRFWRTLVILGLGLTSVAGWVRLIEALSNWHLLVTYGADSGPLWIAITGVLGGVAGLVAVLGLLLRRSWALPWARGYVLGLALLIWSERLLFSRSSAAWAGWPGELVFTLVLIVCALGLLRAKNFPALAVPANQKNQ
ncbi:MAG TPA: hypothetical protein PKG95_08830 [Anaerolineaceae bacterium]|nr:hypothetical protein [Anaerolineaceae bacterium]